MATREKIFERNPDTGVIRWRYTDESPDKFGSGVQIGIMLIIILCYPKS